MIGGQRSVLSNHRVRLSVSGRARISVVLPEVRSTTESLDSSRVLIDEPIVGSIDLKLHKMIRDYNVRPSSSSST